MRSRHTLALVALLVAFVASSASASTIFGPVYPAPGGNTFSFIGNNGNPGGGTASYGGFSLPAGINLLYWGPDANFLPTASLDGTPHSLTFGSTSGTTATWSGTTSWTDPNTATFYASIPIRLQITVSGLGATPWVLSTSVTDLDPGAGAGTGAVVDDAAELSFSANLLFSADTGSGFIPINTVLQGSGGLTLGSFTGAFYAPEPGSGLLLGSGLLGLALRRRRS